MKKLDWYILRKLLVTFIFMLMGFTVIGLAVDSSEKADDFVKSGFSTFELIERYYSGFVPWLWGLLFPLFVFLATIFFTSKMAAKSEIVAILASGTSYNRFLRPYLVGGGFLSVILWVASLEIIPKGNEKRADFQAKYVDNNNPANNRDRKSMIYKRADTNTYVGIREYDTGSRMATGFFMEKVSGDEVIFNMRADLLRWDTAKKKWQIQNGVERTVDSMKETVVMLPEKIIDLPINPDELKKDQYLKDKLSSRELKEFIKRQELRGSEGLNAYKVELYRRTATPAAVLLLTIIGAVIASRKTRGGRGLHMALGILIACLFVLSDRFSTVFSTNAGLSPMLAVWLPNIVFAGVAYWLYRKTPK